MSINVDIHYHKCDNCPGFYFLPCGCAIGHTWCIDCRKDQEEMQRNPVETIVLDDDKNVQNILAEARKKL